MSMSNASTWWGEYTLQEAQSGSWRIGPMHLQIHHLHQEWRILYENGNDPVESTLDIRVPAKKEDLNEPKNVLRFGFSSTDNKIYLTPALADRPIVTEPKEPFSILPGEKITVYASTPLWVRIEAGRSKKMLQEIPLYRPSDTWFGPSFLEGELCYASKIMCRLNLDEIPLRPHRAITAFIIDNQGSDAMLLERLNLPIHYLSLYATDEGYLWTESVLLKRIKDEELSPLQVQKKPPDHVHVHNRITKAREVPGKNILFRAFGSFFR